MINKSVIPALVSGGMTSIRMSTAGGVGLLLYILFTNEKVVYLPQVLAGIALISVLMGGFRGGMLAVAQGWLHGFIIALAYVLISTSARFFLFPESGFDRVLVIQAGSLLAAGIIGGVAGINVRFLRRKRRIMRVN